jgi:hypothetical protein
MTTIDAKTEGRSACEVLAWSRAISDRPTEQVCGLQLRRQSTFLVLEIGGVHGEGIGAVGVGCKW